jgi:hypothetical protein
MYDLATDTFQGDAEQRKRLNSALTSHPKWNMEYERVREEVEASLAPEAPIEVEVWKEGRPLGSFPITASPVVIREVTEGRYSVRLSTGRLLWEGELTREDVLWTRAFPGKELPMAAETEPVDRKPTRTIPLLDGELVMHVFPGLERAVIRMEMGRETQ